MIVKYSYNKNSGLLSISMSRDSWIDLADGNDKSLQDQVKCVVDTIEQDFELGLYARGSEETG